jgi:ketopantoate reductase
MKRILISGICGFVGSTIALRLRQAGAGVEIVGFDNFIRAESELNRLVLKRQGIDVRHADACSATDVEALPAVDWVIDAAANPSVLAVIPWLVLDSSRAERLWGFCLTMLAAAILNEIADHAQRHPDWLEI